MGQALRPLLIKKGAEASIYAAIWHGKKVVMKYRLPKQYRHHILEERIRSYRTAHESQLMHDAKKAGVLSPVIFLVDLKKSLIIMEYVEGRQVKQLLEEIRGIERERLYQQIGVTVAKLHSNGIVHGDLTTSNMIVDSGGRLCLVDFGLAEKTGETESMGVDLHLMKRALESTHYRLAQTSFKIICRNYESVVGSDQAKSVFGKVAEIEKRGRYVTDRAENERKEEDV